VARYGFFDPDASLTAAVEEAAAPRELPHELKKALENGLGGRIFRWLLRKLKARHVRNALSEAQDLFQQFCVRVYVWVGRNGPSVAAPWFWRVARNLFLNHVQRELVEKRDPEQSIDWDAGDTEWLQRRLDGSTAVSRIDPWTEARLGPVVLRCIAQLPRRQQEFLYLDLVERLSGADLDTALNLHPKSRAALKAKVARNLRDKIRAELERVPEPLRRLHAKTRPES
jgi:DNA-directed RNA polymerase specialized sigma24 family protein